MATFLAIVVTFLLTLVFTFFGTICYILWTLHESRNMRDYWRGLIEDYSDYDE